MYERRDAAYHIFELDHLEDEELDFTDLKMAFDAGWKARKELDYKPMTDIK